MAKDKYQDLTERLVAAMQDFLDGKRERLPWQRPWNPSRFAPQNGKSGHVYSGLNVVLSCLASRSDQ